MTPIAAPTMKNIHLHGSLAVFGAVHSLNVTNPVMAVRMLVANCGRKFETAIRNGRFHIVRGSMDAEKLDDIGEEEVMMNTSKQDIHIIPAVEGSSGILKTIVGIVLVVVGVVYDQPWLIKIGASMALSGVAQMLAGTPKTGDYTKANVAVNPSFVFNGAVNTVAQGGPIPLVYGRYRTGTTIISAGIEVAQLDANTGLPADPITDIAHS